MNAKTKIAIPLTLLFLALVPAVHATNQVVSDCGDNGGANQLRSKLNAAQATGGGTITFTCGPSIPLLQGSLPPITTKITINGGGVIAINGNLAFRIFRVTSTGSLTLNSITLDSGISTASDSPPGGGAINSDGALSLNNVTLQNNQATSGLCGGAIFANGALSISNSRFSNNDADYGGGAICTGSNLSTTKVTITNSSFSGNQATSTNLNSGLGGAIYINQNGGTLTVTDTGFSTNQAQFGGAIYLSPGANGTLRTQNTARATYFLSNYSSDSGGAVMNLGTLTVNGVQFNTNAAQNVLGSGYGGAIANLGSLTVSDSSFSANSGRFGGALLVGETLGVSGNAVANVNRSSFYKNTAAVFGGGIYANANTARLYVNNSSFDQNSAASGGGIKRFNARVDISNSSFAYNKATGDGGGLSITFGGFNTDPTYVSVTSATFSSNTSDNAQGGGIFNNGYAVLRSLTLKDNTNGIFVGSNAITTHLGDSALDNPVNCAGSGSAILEDNPNLSTDNTCAVSIQNTPAQLDVLTTNTNGVNQTKYHLPLAGSPLIDAGANCTTLDQRGVARLGPCDLGAVERLPIVQNSSISVQYNGWRGFSNASASGGSYRMSNVTNDSVSYSFSGTSIKWITRKTPAMGIATVTIDGLSKGQYDLYSSSVLWNQQILFGNLSTGSHKIVVQVTGTRNSRATNFNVAVDGFLVGTSTTAVQDSAIGVQYNSWTGKTQSAASGGSYLISGTLGAVARLNFSGTAINFVTARGPSYGIVNVYIDGALKSSDLDLYAATQQWQYSLAYSGLANTNHTLEIRPAHSKNPSSAGYGVVVDAFTGPITPL